MKLNCPKSNQNFCDITGYVVKNIMGHEIFRVVSRFPRATFHVISLKIDFFWDSVWCHDVVMLSAVML